jgi:hypothetical protein
MGKHQETIRFRPVALTTAPAMMDKIENPKPALLSLYKVIISYR